MIRQTLLFLLAISESGQRVLNSEISIWSVVHNVAAVDSYSILSCVLPLTFFPKTRVLYPCFPSVSFRNVSCKTHSAIGFNCSGFVLVVVVLFYKPCAPAWFSCQPSLLVFSHRVDFPFFFWSVDFTTVSIFTFGCFFSLLLYPLRVNPSFSFFLLFRFVKVNTAVISSNLLIKSPFPFSRPRVHLHTFCLRYCSLLSLSFPGACARSVSPALLIRHSVLF